MSKFTGRIVRSDEVDPATLTANPANWRQHPFHQREALRELLDKVGWVQQVVVNERTGRLVDGHLRVQLAAEEGEPVVPVVYVDLSEEEERLVLASLDPIGALAVPDVDQLDRLLSELGDENGDHLQGLLDDLIGAHANSSPPPDETPGDPANERDFWPVVRLQVSYDTFRQFTEWWLTQEGEDDDEKLRALIAAPVETAP